MNTSSFSAKPRAGGLRRAWRQERLRWQLARPGAL